MTDYWEIARKAVGRRCKGWSRDDMEDARAVAALHAWMAETQNPGMPEAYVQAAAGNAILNLIRRKARWGRNGKGAPFYLDGMEVDADELGLTGESLSAGDEAMSRMQKASVENALHILTDEERAFIESLLRGESGDTSRSAAKSAFRKLRERLGEWK